MSPRRDDDQLGLFGAPVTADAPIDGNLALRPQLPAVPEADDIASVAMDIWANGKGYRKLRENLLGI